MKPLILQYLKNFKLFLCLADLPNLNDLMWAFFQKIEYKNFLLELIKSTFSYLLLFTGNELFKNNSNTLVLYYLHVNPTYPPLI